MLWMGKFKLREVVSLVHTQEELRWKVGRSKAHTIIVLEFSEPHYGAPLLNR